MFEDSRMTHPLWSKLPSELEKASLLLTKKRGEAIYREHDSPKGLYLVEEGLVGLILHGAVSGKEHLVRFFREGQIFGHRALFAEEGYHGTTLALEPTRLRLLPRAPLLEALGHSPTLYKEIAQILAKELRRAELQHVMILENQILSRTAQALVYLKDLHPEHRWTRQEIANFCASTTSTIIKALAQLETKGLIRQEGRDIEIVDRQGLIELQDDDSE